jgi:hypothetical protein
MNLQELVIDPDEARERLAEYEGLIAAERTAEDVAIAAGYRAAARGLGVIDLDRTIAAGGFHDNSLPRLAIARAGTAVCFAWWDSSSVTYADADNWRVNQGALVNRHSVRVPFAGDDLPDRSRRRSAWSAGSAMVPLIPPRFRPRLRRLPGFHILWEVEEWTRQPPRDPALVRHIRGSLWAVHAVWDLTDLERTVLSQRAAG